MTDFDPTTNRVQTRLLTDEEQKTLEEWPHGLLYYNNVDRKWSERSRQSHPLHGAEVYRGKPAPETELKWFGWLSGDKKVSNRERHQELYNREYNQYLVFEFEAKTGRLISVKIHELENTDK